MQSVTQFTVSRVLNEAFFCFIEFGQLDERRIWRCACREISSRFVNIHLYSRFNEFTVVWATKSISIKYNYSHLSREICRSLKMNRLFLSNPYFSLNIFHDGLIFIAFGRRQIKLKIRKFVIHWRYSIGATRIHCTLYQYIFLKYIF